MNRGFAKILIVFIVLIILVGGGFFSWQYLKTKKETKSGPGGNDGTGGGIITEAVLAKTLIKSEDIVLEEVDVVPQIPSYNLPLKISDISNWQELFQKLSINPNALSLLEKNGFVVIETPKELGSEPDDFVDFYSNLKNKDLPVFITSDSLLHYYHIFFDTTLMKLEKDLFYDDIWQISKELLDDSTKQYNEATGDLKTAAKRNIAYLSIALELLKPKPGQVISEESLKEEYCPSNHSSSYCDYLIGELKTQYGDKVSFKYFSEKDFQKYFFEIPDIVKKEVQKEINLIKEHKGWEFSPVFIYKEDYSQYVPRGHYTKSEKLKNYFKALMWYGRMTNLIAGSELIPQGKSLRKAQEEGLPFSVYETKALLSNYDSKIQTLQSSLISKKFSESESIEKKWQRMYAITSFFVGFSDDLGPYEYSAVLDKLFKDNINFLEIEKNFSDVKNTLLKLSYNPKIYSGLDEVQMVMPFPPLSEEEINELKNQAKMLLGATKGFRLMGQRYTIDSWLFSEIVSPYSGEYTGDKTPRPFTWVKTATGREVKGFPRGLDVMALFGSERAKEILKELGDTEYSDYEEKFNELKSEIDSFSTDDWFKNLYWNWLYVLKSLFNKYEEGYQTFMQTQAWQDKQLNTALASWAELRHDTILYVKQSYTMAEMGMPLPPPPIVGYVEPVPEFYARLLTLTKMTNKGLKNLVPQEELNKLRINEALERFADILDKLLEISEKELKNKSLSDKEYDFIKDFGSTSESLIDIVSGGNVDPEILKTVLIADVHTDGNTEKVLEEGVGYIKTIITAYKLPQGHILAGVGPVFSYYEFKHPMNDRLTDEAWRELLEVEQPSEPEWIKSFAE